MSYEQSDPRNDADSSCYICAGMYTMYLNKNMLVKKIPVGILFSARPDRPWGPPSLLQNGYKVFPEGKVRSGRAANHSPPSSAAVMEE